MVRASASSPPATASPATASPATPAPATPFAAMDACHGQIHQQLQRLKSLTSQLAAGQLDEAARKQVAEIEAFFSSVSRQHHADEEALVFPPLLAGGDPELANAVRTLQQDHGWIEEDWLQLAPQLRSVAEGYHWVEPAELAHAVEVFINLCDGHIALEESLIYPESKARWAAQIAQRQARMAR